MKVGPVMGTSEGGGGGKCSEKGTGELQDTRS